MSSIHIAILCPACGRPGSVAQVALRHARELSRYFAVSLLSDSLPKQRVAGIGYLKVDAPRFDYLRGFCHVPNELGFVLAARRHLQRLDADKCIHAVLCHGHAAAALAGKALRDKRGVPFALIQHGDIFERPSGIYDRRLIWFYKAVTPTAYRHAALIVALSPNMAEWAVRGGADPDTIEIIPNGIDPGDIGWIDTPATLDQREGLQLLYVGRMAREKGVDVLLQCCLLLSERGVDYHLRLIGAGNLLDGYSKLAVDLGVDRRVEFLGDIARERLGMFYRGAHIVCVPSISDSLPAVVLEALTAGRAVVGSDVGGIPFMVSDGETGVILPAGSSEALADTLQQFAERPELVERMGKKAAASVFPRFDWSYIGQQLGTAVERLARRENRNP